MVSFAAVLTEQKANETAQGINVNGNHPRVVAVPQGSATVYRVVLGPFSTREEADKAGRDAGRSYWVYEETK
jgi:cell division protein FtsN